MSALAAALAAMGAIAAAADDGMAGGPTAAQVFVAEAIIGAVFAALPSNRPWSDRRRTLAGVSALVTSFLALPLAFLTMARAACGCGDPATGYMLPTFFGLVAHDWVIIAAIAFPVLMALTTARALGRVRSSDGPG
jgi:hypothetical protein